MPEVSKTHLGGTMRLGARRTLLQTPDCITARLYQAEQFIDERHRHRYEVGGCELQVLNSKWDELKFCTMARLYQAERFIDERHRHR